MSVLRRLEKIYAFVFYVQYKCATAFGSQEWGEQNAVFAMATFEYILWLELLSAVALIAGHTPISFPKFGVALGYGVALLITHFTLVRKGRWLPYKSEFERYSKRKHFFASLAVGILMALALLGIAVIKTAIGAVGS